MRLKTIALSALLVCLSATAVAEKEVPAPKIAPDESLPIAGYIEAGTPATDREWTPSDYARLAAVLGEIGEENPRRLPRFDSAKSDALMRRMMSADNLRILRDTKLPLETRLSEGLTLMQAIGALATIYAEATNKGESFDRELVEILTLIARVGVDMWTLADEMLAGMSAEERAQRGGALDTMRGGSAQVVQGILTTFTERSVYRPAELQRFAELLTPVLPSLIRRLTPESQAEAMVQLKKTVTEAGDPAVASALRKLLAAAEEGTPRPPA